MEKKLEIAYHVMKIQAVRLASIPANNAHPADQIVFSRAQDASPGEILGSDVCLVWATLNIPEGREVFLDFFWTVSLGSGLEHASTYFHGEEWEQAQLN